jgi:hypothetical protein
MLPPPPEAFPPIKVGTVARGCLLSALVTRLPPPTIPPPPPIGFMGLLVIIIPPLLGRLLMATVELLILAMLIVLTYKSKNELRGLYLLS